MTLLDIARLRLLNQQIAHSECKTPADVVRWLGAVQAQDLLGSLWAIGLRLPRPVTEADIEQAIADKTIVRSWPMRGTIHFMPAEDAKWMIRLLAPRIDAKAAANYRRAGLSQEIIAQAGEVFKQTLSGRQCTRAEIYAALTAAGIATGAQNGEQRGMHLLVHWARHGLICLAPRRGKQQTFALLDEWLPAGNDLTGETALAELTRRYFRSHGPATVKDFAWWTGLTTTEAKRIVTNLKDELHAQTIEGVEYWVAAQPAKATIPSRAYLLPPYDEYTIAYIDRNAAVSRTDLTKAKYGIAPNIIIDGRIVGTWKRVIKKDKVEISFDLLRPLAAKEKSLVHSAAKEYAEFLNLSV